MLVSPFEELKVHILIKNVVKRTGHAFDAEDSATTDTCDVLQLTERRG
jgi:hypothetical protein